MVVFDTQPDRRTERPRRPAVRRATGRRHRYQPRPEICQDLITKPNDTILVLITDLYEGGDARRMQQRMEDIVQSGVQLIVLLALNDDGSPSYDRQHAHFLAGLGVPVFACTPDLFPELMATAISKRDLKQWAGENEVVLKG